MQTPRHPRVSRESFAGEKKSSKPEKRAKAKMIYVVPNEFLMAITLVFIHPNYVQILTLYHKLPLAWWTGEPFPIEMEKRIQ